MFTRLQQHVFSKLFKSRTLLPIIINVAHIIQQLNSASQILNGAPKTDEYRFPGAIRSMSAYWDIYLNRLNLSKDYVLSCNKSSSILPAMPQFVTGLSNNHLNEAAEHVLYHFFEYFKDDRSMKLIVYDLGLSDGYKHKLISTYGSRIIFAKLDFNQYPVYVRRLNQYRWKPLIIAEVLKSYPAVFWVDAQAYFNFSANIQPIIDWTTNSDFGLALFSHSRHSIYFSTHEEFYNYFPLTIEDSISTEQFAAGFFLIYRSCRSSEVLFWWLLCALEKRCMGPTLGRIPCYFDLGNTVNECELSARSPCFNEYGYCHRYDMSALNTLLTLFSNHDYRKYVFEGEQLICNKFCPVAKNCTQKVWLLHPPKSQNEYLISQMQAECYKIRPYRHHIWPKQDGYIPYIS